MAKETYVQIGVTALRSQTGGFLPSVPLYIKTSEARKASGLTPAEESTLHDVAIIFAIKHIERTAEGGNGRV